MSQQHATTLRFLAEPAHVNFGGKVHGGAVMKWIDQAGYACAARWSGSYCVTAYVGGIQFMRPIQVGELVEVRAPADAEPDTLRRQNPFHRLLGGGCVPGEGSGGFAPGGAGGGGAPLFGSCGGG